VGRGRPATREGDETTIGLRSIIYAAIVLGGVIAIGTLIASHPVTGAGLAVGVAALVLVLGLASSRNRER
jgi:hypothetical protein